MTMKTIDQDKTAEDHVIKRVREVLDEARKAARSDITDPDFLKMLLGVLADETELSLEILSRMVRRYVNSDYWVSWGDFMPERERVSKTCAMCGRAGVGGEGAKNSEEKVPGKLADWEHGHSMPEKVAMLIDFIREPKSVFQACLEMALNDLEPWVLKQRASRQRRNLKKKELPEHIIPFR